MAVEALRAFAAGSGPAVYPCVGPGMLPAVERLFLSPSVRRAWSPRHAGLLLVAGRIEGGAQEALDRLHDQLPRPRGTFRWDGRDDPIPALRARWRDVLAGADEDDRLPDVPPTPWQGRGDHGQGGEGMMGGTPYGRPMAMTGEDLRDGLMLDRYTARVGPFAPMLLPGLELELTLQGDVIVAAELRAPPFEQPPEASRPAACAARLLRLLGLDRQADRLLRTGRGPSAARAAWLALPHGLGAASDGSDVRARLHGWLAGQEAGGAARAPSELLPGAEWHEAMLSLASFTPDALRRACLPEMVA